MAGYNNFIGYGYPTNYAMTGVPQAGYLPQAQTSYQQPPQQKVGIEWVDGEVGAKAFQLPQGWPANVPMPLWDTNDTVIYLKSVNQMGMPNPIQKVHYTMDPDNQFVQQPALSGQSASMDTSRFATKDELAKMVNELKDELKAAINSVKEVKWNGKSSV